MNNHIDGSLRERLDDRVVAWHVNVEETRETESSIIAFGAREDQPVVIKIVRRPGDEWRSGEVLAAFHGNGTVRVIEQIEGAMLLERLTPGTPLVDMSIAGRDEEATEILADVIKKMASVRRAPEWIPSAERWGRAFADYRTSSDQQIPRTLIESAEPLYAELCATQKRTRLLHGDLQHYNVLFDENRGWLSVDPKGVIGEVEYELGASLRNPGENVLRFFSPATVIRRLEIYESILGIDIARALRWAYAQAVLSLIWGVEDGYTVTDESPSLILARSIEPLL
ncbi:MAG TPA: aminoglycoside phosphotransferase family protein [Gemmatimonadaceae bacterium]